MAKSNKDITLPMALAVKIELFKRGCFDFITTLNGVKHEKQESALKILTDHEHVELLYGGAAGGAKSWTGAAWLMFSCLSYPGTKWFCGRESLKRITQSTLITFNKVAAAYGIEREAIYKYNGQLNYIEFYNGSRIDMLDLRYIPSDSLYERYGSIEYTGGWIEEGGEVNFGAYDTLKTRIGRHMNDQYGLLRKILITCNPKKNWMYQVFYKPANKGELSPHMYYLPCLVQENPFIEKDYIEALSSTTDKVKKERLLKGNWDYDDSPNALCSYDAIMAIFGNILAIKTEVKYLTADIARFGSDFARIAVWDGYNIIDLKSFPISKTTEIQTYIKRCQYKYRIPNRNCIADEDGVGGGVVDNCDIVGFVNNSRALKDENYQNLQTQCGYKLAEHINDSDIGVDRDLVTNEDVEQIALELGQLQTWDADSDGKLKLKPKEEIKNDIGCSPDWRDMFLMRCWFDYNEYNIPENIERILGLSD
ncbi:MAG TPA: phage portal protein [Porphyromonadaceae bacterium]|nr:phage portal protein [Porphyromonadaceae bacterium]